jgi:hypothetical protein
VKEMKNNNSKPNNKTKMPKTIRTEEELERYLKETNHRYADLIIEARRETRKIFGRMLTTKEIDKLYFND